MLLSSSREMWKDTGSLVLSDAGEKCLSARVGSVVSVLPGGGRGRREGLRLGVVRRKFMSSAIHGCGPSRVAQGCVVKLRAARASAIWFRRMPLAHTCGVFPVIRLP